MNFLGTMKEIPKERARVVCWFSCGTASAVATKIAIDTYGRAGYHVDIARCIVPEEHPDNDRFAADCERWFKWSPIINLRSSEYESAEDVWRKRRYMSGPKGAACTVEMKKAVRWAYEQEHHPDFQVFGYTSDERKRVRRFVQQNPDVTIVNPLIERGLDKEACHAIVERAGIERSEMYRLGFPNANCQGCVNAQSPGYWNLTRRVVPEVWERRRALSRELGVRLVKIGDGKGKRKRVFIDELDPDAGLNDPLPAMPECSLLCYTTEGEIT
jgi:hypothetical protein